MDTILNNIYSDIFELSSIEQQKQYWLGNDSKNISSYVEVMSRLFDDNNFDGFIDNIAQNHGFDQHFIFELDQLRKLLNEYEEKESDSEIINDPKWKPIVIQAKKIIKRWKI
jgi:hypothetical protein